MYKKPSERGLFQLFHCFVFCILFCAILQNTVLHRSPQRRRKEHRRVRTCKQTEQNRKREVAHRNNAESRKHNDHNKRRKRREHRTVESHCDRFVRNVVINDFVFVIQLFTFAHAVENDNRVVDRIRNDGDNRGDETAVYGYAADNRKTYHNKHVVQQRKDSRNAREPLEPDNDINKNQDKSDANRQEGFLTRSALAVELLLV